MNARHVATAALIAIAAMLSGCGGTPEPEETAAFASEEEAFAAAEETYRAYVDALNHVDLSDPETFEPVFALTTGDANANERQRLSQMHSDGWTLSGKSVLEGFLPSSTEDSMAEEIEAVACMNVSDVSVDDSTGQSKVSPDRRDTYSLQVAFIEASGRQLISSSNAIEDERCGR